MTIAPAYQLRRNAFGKLEFIGSDGEIHAGVVPVRAFPITAPDDGIGLTSPALLIADSHGIHFLIRDRYALDQYSRRILDRFL